MSRLFTAGSTVTPDTNPRQGSAIIGTNGERVQELISKQEAFQYNTGYVYACAHKNAMVVSASRLRMFVMNAEGSAKTIRPHVRLKGEEKRRMLQKATDSRVVGGVELDEIFDHPFLSLIREPYEMGTHQTLLANTQNGMELQGDSLWVITFNRYLGTPETIQVVPIDRVAIELKKNGSIKHYLVDIADGRKLRVPLENALHFKMPPSYDYFGTSPLTAASLSVKLFNNTLLYETALAKNSAVPSTLITYKDGHISVEDMKVMEHDWDSRLRGLNKRGGTKVVGENVDVSALALPPKDTLFLEGRKMQREDICAAFDTPITLFTSEANLASAKTAIDIYNLYGIAPRLQTLEQAINTKINTWYPEAGGRLFVVLENQMTLKDEAVRQNLVFTAFGQEIIDRDEARNLLNLGE